MKFNDYKKHGTLYVIGPISYLSATNMEFWKGNVIKFVTRSDFKGFYISTEIEDLDKAKWYLEHRIKELEAHLKKQGEQR